jgi:putative endonuclease
MTPRRQALGARGEAMAADWYEANGYQIVARNWRCREGEIDLIARRGSTLVFCEVKTRTSDAYGIPAESVTRTKQLRIRRLASAWLDEAPSRGSDIRFDVVAILAGQLEVIEGAF